MFHVLPLIALLLMGGYAVHWVERSALDHDEDKRLHHAFRAEQVARQKSEEAQSDHDQRVEDLNAQIADLKASEAAAVEAAKNAKTAEPPQHLDENACKIHCSLQWSLQPQSD